MRVRRAVTLLALASLYRGHGDLDAARLRLREALTILNGLEHDSVRAATMLTLGQVLVDEGHPEAQHTLESARAACRRLGVGSGEALALRTLGDLHRTQGHADLAVTRCAEALAIVEGLDRPPLLGWVLRSLGDAHHALGAHSAARDAWAQARAVHADLGNQSEVETLDALLACSTVDPSESIRIPPDALPSHHLQ